VWLTFGCHPNKANRYNEDVELDLWRCLLHPKTVGVGEIGLDNFCGVPPNVQLKVNKDPLSRKTRTIFLRDI